MAARSRLATLIDDPTTTQEVRQDARFFLAKGYLADGHYAEALAVLEELDAEFVTATTASAAPAATFDRQVETYLLRALVLNGAGVMAKRLLPRSTLASYPQLAALVQPRIARAYGDLR